MTQNISVHALDASYFEEKDKNQSVKQCDSEGAPQVSKTLRSTRLRREEAGFVSQLDGM